MPVQLTLGTHNVDHVTAAEELRIPALDAVHAMGAVLASTQDALNKALQLKTGILLIGPKWSGKSTAVGRAIRLLRDEEERLLAAMPEAYRVRRVLTTHGLQSKTAREFLLALLQKVSPGLRDRHLGMRKDDDTLRHELVSALLNKNYGVIVCDEAEYLNDRAVDQLRKIMADATERDDRRVVVGPDGESYKAAGVGVLLVGTSKLLDVVRGDADNGHRWSEAIHVDTLPPNAIGTCYQAIFPAFGHHITSIGVDEWATFCANHVALGRKVPVGKIVLHARRYFSAFLSSELADAQANVARETVPFNRALFLYTLDAAPSPAGSRHGSK